MTIVDTRFAAEIVTPKGKAYKFDDVVCLKQFATESEKNEEGTKYFVADYTNDKDKFLEATKAIYLKSEFFKSPMNGNSAAFSTQEIAKHLADSLNLQPISWNNLK
jgi:copper chaperone NosL